jgi:1,2-phenylacetyl-CoA epoxidase catalytic subunit
MIMASGDTQTVLRLADTKLVLANICATTVFNGRSVGDFATLLAITSTSLGATRALYRWLESQGQSYTMLERGRNADSIAAMDMLDAPPTSWTDLMVEIFLAEAATSAIAKTLTTHSDRLLANQAGIAGRDGAFHMAYCVGWLKIMVQDERAALTEAIAARMPLALRWVEHCDASVTTAFVEACAPLAELSGSSLPTSAHTDTNWNAELARSHSLPAGLWEIVRFKDAELLA